MAVDGTEMYYIWVDGEFRGEVYINELGKIIYSFVNKTYVKNVTAERVASTKEKEFPFEYICQPCAIEKGGRWPEGHVATFHPATCPYCMVPNKSLCNIGDFGWPDNKKRGMRD